MVMCPVDYWFCSYFENGECTLKNCEEECRVFYSLEDEEEDEEEEEIEDKYTLDDLGNNWY